MDTPQEPQSDKQGDPNPSDEDLKNIDIVPEEKHWAALSYVIPLFLCLIPLFVKRESEYCQFHAKQGLVLAILFAVMRTLYMVPMLIPILGIIEVTLSIVGILMALSGRWWKIPIIYNISKKIRF